MINRVLNINDVDVYNKPVVFTCYGLGSCIGLFITDRLNGISGGTHIPLPKDDLLFEGVSTLIDQLLLGLNNLGGDKNFLRAKFAGGSQIYPSALNIGAANALHIMEKLIQHKIFIASHDVGGRVSRTVRYNSLTGDLQINTSENKMYCI